MEIEIDETSELTAPCWPFWGLLQTAAQSSSNWRSTQVQSWLMVSQSPTDIFNRFESIGRQALRMLERRTLDDLIAAATAIQSEIESSIDWYIEDETNSLVRELFTRGGYQMMYLPEDAGGSEYEIRELLDNWSSEWESFSGAPQRDDLTDLEALANYLEFNKYDEATFFHCGLYEPDEYEFYAVLALMIICDAIHLNTQKSKTPKSISQVIAIGTATVNAIEAIAYADRIQFEAKIKKALATEQLAFLASEVEARIKAREAETTQRLSEAGAQGAKIKNQLTDELKIWALEKAGSMRGADRIISRELSARIPLHLADASKAPERLIYDALRKRSKLI